MAAVATPPSTPAPVSPLAAVLAIPGQVANAGFEFVGITAASGTTPPPISPAPIVDLLFAAFRRLEDAAGLNKPITTPPLLVLTDPVGGTLDTRTPTVAQFLDAATTTYVLGGTPAGLAPFTVDGFPVQYANVFTGTAAQVWVTPQSQIIIAYQGTGGGTNLLVNPLIAVSQALADLQIILTNTVPPAFPDALRFARLVQAEAARQGYDPDGVFVTGHSLGGWEAEYVAQHTGWGGIGFESPGLPSIVPGNGVDSLFVNVATYGDPAAYLATDLPGLQPFARPYVPGGGRTPHYGPIVLLGDPSSLTPLVNASGLWGKSLLGDLVFLVVFGAQVAQYHLPGVQAYSLDVNPTPAVGPGIGHFTGPVYTGYGQLGLPEFLRATAAAGILITP